MTSDWRIAVVWVGAYLAGGIPFGLIVGRLHGIDIRQHGSGNLGATNVGRVLGRGWGLAVFFLDLVKGAGTMLAAGALCDGWGLVSAGGAGRDYVLLGTGFCCVLGNTAPIYLRFRGGKGVATSLGVILGVWPYLTVTGLATFVIWALVVRVSGYISVGSIVAALCLPGVFVIAGRILGWDIGQHHPLLILCAVMSVVVVVRHRANITRLMAGTENKLGQREPPLRP